MDMKDKTSRSRVLVSCTGSLELDKMDNLALDKMAYKLDSSVLDSNLVLGSLALDKKE